MTSCESNKTSIKQMEFNLNYSVNPADGATQLPDLNFTVPSRTTVSNCYHRRTMMPRHSTRTQYLTQPHSLETE